MVLKNGSGHNRSMNGGTDFVSGQIWRHRFTAMKGCICVLFIINLFYFAMRHVELTKTVKRLEAEKLANCPHKELNMVPTKVEKATEKLSKEAPLLNYSQVRIVQILNFCLFRV